MLEKVTERIYYMMNDNQKERPALGVVVGDKGCLIIDAGNSPKHARELKKELIKYNLPEVSYVVITHYHWDHSFGLIEWQVPAIGNALSNEKLKAYRQLSYDNTSLEKAANHYFTRHGIDCIKSEIDNRDSFKPVGLDFIYSGELTIDLGDITCQIKQVQSSHTCDSTIVYIPEEKTVFLGDCAYGHNSQGYNYYNREMMFPMLDLIFEYEADYYLCSHESICSREEMVEYYNNLKMGADIAGRVKNMEEAKTLYKNTYQREPSEEDIFFIRSFGVGEGFGRIGTRDIY
jgi:glyoxylase-like metal-dependent hydrolase (beta-lactamase superfamily II)